MRLVVIALIVASLAGAAAAQQTRPATRPADASTPKDALRLLNLALRDGDADTVKSLFQTRTTEETKLVAAMADYAAALASLHRESAKVFGSAGANAVTGDTDAESSEGLDAIEHADITIEGDRAIVKYKGADGEVSPVNLTKVNGKWKLPISQLVGDADKSAERHRLEELASQTKLAQATCDEIAHGKYKAADDAAHAWQSRLLDVVLASATQKKGE